MSFDGYTEQLSNVGGGFLSVIHDMGDYKTVGNTLTIVPVGILFFIFSCYGVMLGFISLNSAIIYTFFVVISLGFVLRLKKQSINSEKNS